jgi:hypothetical protein
MLYFLPISSMPPGSALPTSAIHLQYNIFGGNIYSTFLSSSLQSGSSAHTTSVSANISPALPPSNSNNGGNWTFSGFEDPFIPQKTLLNPINQVSGGLHDPLIASFRTDPNEDFMENGEFFVYHDAHSGLRSNLPRFAFVSPFALLNNHLLHYSELMREIIQVYHMLVLMARSSLKIPGAGTLGGSNSLGTGHVSSIQQGNAATSHPIESEFLFPWDHIFPKTKDGTPSINSSTGRYAVKLFWCGSWRKVIVDDKIPVDSEGRALLLSSPIPGEIWPLILTKAILKVACLRYFCPFEFSLLFIYFRLFLSY